MTSAVNETIAHIAGQTETQALRSRLSAIQSIPGNPMGVEIKEFGQATAFTVKNIPGPSFNKVTGMSDFDADKLKEILRYYEARNIPVQFDISPVGASNQLLFAMAKEGLYQSGFHTSFYKKAERCESPKEEGNIVIREIKGDEFQLFSKLYIKGFNLPEFTMKGIEENNAILYDHADWTFYLAFYQNEPVGLGVLYVNGHTASLNAAAVIPEHRGKGIHQALIKKRIHAASNRHSKKIFSQASFNSTSHRNMEKAGLTIAFTNAIWKPLM
ncbi:GNAT family N-acetyltransferase [Cytobacillus horneckiae]|uniref:GNAT family N-acetyltransferase n=1 Tax=Cytobacillus horneckiae TaxID=549687 RepID=UPI003D9A46D7